MEITSIKSIKHANRMKIDINFFLANHLSSDNLGYCGKSKNQCESGAMLLGLAKKTAFVCLANGGCCPQEQDGC